MTIKVGQVYKGGDTNICVTQVDRRLDGDRISTINNNGFSENIFDFELVELLAEYPTWQEAVNSKEFNQ